MSQDPLLRLLKNAALHAQQERVDEEMAFPVQARILAAWRTARSETEAFLPLLRKAVLAAGAVTALAVGLTLFFPDIAEPAGEDEITAITRSLNEAIEIVVIQ